VCVYFTFTLLYSFVGNQGGRGRGRGSSAAAAAAVHGWMERIGGSEEEDGGKREVRGKRDGRILQLLFLPYEVHALVSRQWREGLFSSSAFLHVWST